MLSHWKTDSAPPLNVKHRPGNPARAVRLTGWCPFPLGVWFTPLNRGLDSLEPSARFPRALRHSPFFLRRLAVVPLKILFVVPFSSLCFRAFPRPCSLASLPFCVPAFRLPCPSASLQYHYRPPARSCQREKAEFIVRYVTQPEDIGPGIEARRGSRGENPKGKM